MEKEQQENTFFYTYSAKQQTEIQAIRQKYLSAASSDEGVERLRKLDKGARRLVYWQQFFWDCLVFYFLL